MQTHKEFHKLLVVLGFLLLSSTSAFADYRSGPGLACGLVGPLANSCPGFTTCGGDGRAGICGCTVRSSYPTGACGVYQDGCGGFTDLGGCAAGQTCGGDGTCQAVGTAENITCGGTIQSNKTYSFTGGTTTGTCFSIGGSVSNVIIDGAGKTLNAATAFFISNGAHNILIKNFVINANDAVAIGSNFYPDPTTCTNLPRDIKIAGNNIVRGGIGMDVSTAYACNLRIEGNRIQQGSIDLAHYRFAQGVGGHIIVDNVLEQRNSTNTGFSIDHLDQVLLLHNSIKHLSNVSNSLHLSMIENSIHVTGAIGGVDNNGVSMLHMALFGQSLFAGNYIHNQESTSNSIYRMAINTYESQNNEYLWNTIIQQLPSPVGNSEQMAINFRSAGKDNYLYRNYLRSYYASGYALKTLEATDLSVSPCVIDLVTGQTALDCDIYRNVIDSNTIIGSSHALYLSDSHSFTVRNNILVGEGSDAVYGCGNTPHTWVNNILDGGVGFSGGSCPQSSNNLVYGSSMSSWFKDRTNADYHLRSGAGAIDQASSVNALAPIDLEGISRPFGAKADNGPYEFINDSQAPSVPSGITATPLSWSRIRLNWSASTDNDAISHYNVYIYSGGSFVLLKSVPFTRNYAIGLDTNTAYRFKISAVDRSGNESAQSAEISATTLSGPAEQPPGDKLAPNAPTNLTIN